MKIVQFAAILMADVIVKIGVSIEESKVVVTNLES
jgi:hypothetical protein